MEDQHRGGEELVVDTSVLVKVLLPETDAARARLLEEDLREGRIRLVALDFLFAEFANVRWKKTRRGELNQEAAGQRIAELLDLLPLLEVVPVAHLLGAAYRTACRYAYRFRGQRPQGMRLAVLSL